MEKQSEGYGIPSSQYLSSGKFASLCRTTKETLRHYRNIGLLEPASIAENGYALYSPLQLGDFFLISSLQHAGSSLADIKLYLDNPQGPKLESILESHLQCLEEEQRALQIRQRFLEDTIERNRMLRSWEGNIEGWQVVELEEESFLEIDMSYLFAKEYKAENRQREVEQFIDQGMSLLEQGMASRLQGTYRIGREALSCGMPETDFHLCLNYCEGENGYEKHSRPAGRYFQRLRSGTIEEMLAFEGAFFEPYAKLLDEAQERGFTPIGSVYEQELSLYAGSISEKVYTVLSVRIA